MKARCAAAVMFTLTSLLLVGCDAWPTQVVDRSGQPIQFRWHHKDYPEWSPWVAIRPGKYATLARAHFVEDFIGMEVAEGGHRYSVRPAQMDEFRRICSRSLFDHMTTLGDCEIAYTGEGRFRVRRVHSPVVAGVRFPDLSQCPQTTSFFPARALSQGKIGSATLQCRVRRREASSCLVDGEDGDYNFGRAAQKAALKLDLPAVADSDNVHLHYSFIILELGFDHVTHESLEARVLRCGRQPSISDEGRS